MHYGTDKLVAPGIYRSLSSIYNAKLVDQAAVVQFVVQKAMPCLRQLLNLPKNVVVRVGPIKARGINGRYINGSNLAEIDCRLMWDKALVTLCHEMVHAEQYHTGRLSSAYVRSKGFVHTWNGSLDYNKGTTYKAYREQPWEVEAFDRQNELADKVNEMLGGF